MMVFVANALYHCTHPEKRLYRAWYRTESEALREMEAYRAIRASYVDEFKRAHMISDLLSPDQLNRARVKDFRDREEAIAALKKRLSGTILEEEAFDIGRFLRETRAKRSQKRPPKSMNTRTPDGQTTVRSDATTISDKSGPPTRTLVEFERDIGHLIERLEEAGKESAQRPSWLCEQELIDVMWYLDVQLTARESIQRDRRHARGGNKAVPTRSDDKSLEGGPEINTSTRECLPQSWKSDMAS